MKIQFPLRIITFTLVAALTPTILTAQTPSDEMPGKLHTCPSRTEPTTGAPSVEQVKTYFQCDTEKEVDIGDGYLKWITNLTIEVAPVSRPFNERTDGRYLSIDIKEPVYDIRGTYINHFCNKRNGYCDIDQYYGSAGICYRNTFRDWHCHMTGPAKRIRN
ncbi:hypothetical protein [Nostoc sp. MS1]|uniref:hypothetical protein n=1 Tax=Nostoc sp. MS1 TaxID=2764711 RepID=UPI001CC70D2B|nr:hypothetical protein [Nostoc sp. MS1]BCL37970.1 hypothetical protein NSMS1_44170 [Nostoc sp. MS1]